MSPCGCGVNTPWLIEVNGEARAVFGLGVVLASLEEEGCLPDHPEFARALLIALRKTGNRIPKGQEGGYVPAIAEVFQEYLRANQKFLEAQKP